VRQDVHDAHAKTKMAEGAYQGKRRMDQNRLFFGVRCLSFCVLLVYSVGFFLTQPMPLGHSYSSSIPSPDFPCMPLPLNAKFAVGCLSRSGRIAVHQRQKTRVGCHGIALVFIWRMFKAFFSLRHARIFETLAVWYHDREPVPNSAVSRRCTHQVFKE